ncbi:glycosyltransferase 87 family protein [Streptomyces lincolnensis]|uniref:glycosyltransferase 87 family protein n=1 Tax=Streptomyces lincolnensis TaxID=1915 RepID=UPI001E52F72D|nr:glycosyltransferase 87 family protein [Streptomyces lincolnensis]MCD7444958.1 glycosyltransferase 87 family protein [Streptomyces lincolnensis]
MTITQRASTRPSRTARGVLTGVGHLGRSASSATSARRARTHWTWAYWAACAGFALVLAATTALGPHRVWGICAAVGYATAAVLTLRDARPRNRAGALAALAGAVVVPLAVLVATGDAQSEVGVVERSGALLLHSGSPYLPDPARTVEYTPYLPGMALFGLPRALFGGGALTDARVWFGVAFLVCMFFAARRPARAALVPSAAGPVSAVTLLAGFPAVALPLAVGGVDLPVVGLMCLGLALAGRGGSGVAAGAAMGAAAALKWTAWPLLPVGLVLLAVTAGRRTSLRAAATALSVSALAVVPVALADPHAFVEHVVLFPLGEGGVRSPAASPLPGHLLAAHVPGGSTLATAALGLAALGVALSLLIRPPRTVRAAAYRLALGLAIAICLIPATRFGYLVLPLVLTAWFRLPSFAAERSPTASPPAGHPDRVYSVASPAARE